MGSRHVHGPILQARVRILVGIVVGVATGVAMPARFGGPARVIAGWDASAAAMSVLAWWLILRATPSSTRQHAAEEDPGRHAAWAIAIIASFFSLFASAIVLHGARGRAPETRVFLVGLTIVAVTAAWVLTHTSYTLRYAHLYYRDHTGAGGLEFPGAATPAYVDFAYFALTLGMCFQVSDVQITSPLIRRAVLGHSLLSFAYNTAIVAAAVSAVLGMFG